MAEKIRASRRRESSQRAQGFRPLMAQAVRQGLLIQEELVVLERIRVQKHRLAQLQQSCC